MIAAFFISLCFKHVKNLRIKSPKFNCHSFSIASSIIIQSTETSNRNINCDFVYPGEGRLHLPQCTFLTSCPWQQTTFNTASKQTRLVKMLLCDYQKEKIYIQSANHILRQWIYLSVFCLRLRQKLRKKNVCLSHNALSLLPVHGSTPL